MKFRIVDTGTAVNFSAENAASLQKQIKKSIFKLRGRSPRWRSIMLELQVATDTGEWLSTNYPESNSPQLVSIKTEITPDLFRRCAHANQRGTWMELELKNMSEYAIKK